MTVDLIDENSVEYFGIVGLELDSSFTFQHQVILRPLRAVFTNSFSYHPPAESTYRPWGPPGYTFEADGVLHELPPLPEPYGFTIERQPVDITAELYIGPEAELNGANSIQMASLIVNLVQLSISRNIWLCCHSSHPFDELYATHDQNPDLWLLDTNRRWRAELKFDGLRDLQWVANHWQRTVEFYGDDEKHAFQLALDSICDEPVVRNSASALLSLWAALESLFLREKAGELRFRISALMACYLESRGEECARLQKEVLKLYDHRSRATHTGMAPNGDVISATRNLLQRSLIKMIEEGHVPSSDDLDANLFLR